MKENKVYKVIAILLSIVMIVLMAIFAYQLIKMDILPQNLFIPVILIFVLISLILILWINLMGTWCCQQSVCDDFCIIIYGVYGNWKLLCV